MLDKMKYDVFISYSRKSAELACLAKEKFIENGFTCFTYNQLPAGFDWVTAIKETIRKARIVLLIIDNDFLDSKACLFETKEIFENAKNYDRIIFPLVDQELYSNIEAKAQLDNIIGDTNCFYFDKRHFSIALDNVISLFTKSFKKEILYEKLSEYIDLDYTLKVMSTIKDITNIVCDDLPVLDINEEDNKNSKQYIEIIDLLNVANKHFVCGYKIEDRPIVDEAQALIPIISKIYTPDKYVDGTNLLNISIALHIFSNLTDLNREAIEVRTNGDVRYTLTKQDFKSRNILRALYDRLVINFDEKKYTPKEIQIIKGVTKLNCFNFHVIEGSEARQRDSESISPKYKEKDLEVINSKELFEIAEYINKTNTIFEDIGENELTTEFLTCLKTSYERLKYYSEIVGHKSLSAICIDKLAEINQKLDRMPNVDVEEGVKEESFKALLGFKNRNISSFDVFLSYKHEDDDLASNIYRFIKTNLLNVFYDKVTLPALGKSEYHDAIMDCLDKSNNFVVVLSNLDYMNADWVSLEMKTFNTEINEGRKPDGNFIMIVTPDLFEEIRNTNKRCLPIQYRGCEIMTTLDYKERLISYLKK